LTVTSFPLSVTGIGSIATSNSKSGESKVILSFTETISSKELW
jgi:hypothetical protein